MSNNILRENMMGGSAQTTTYGWTNIQPREADALKDVTYVPSLWGSTLCKVCNINEVAAAQQCKNCYAKAYYAKNKDKMQAQNKSNYQKRKVKVVTPPSEPTTTIKHVFEFHFYFHKAED